MRSRRTGAAVAGLRWLPDSLDAEALAPADALGAVGVTGGGPASGRRRQQVCSLCADGELVGGVLADFRVAQALLSQDELDLIDGGVRVLELELPDRAAGVVDRELDAHLAVGRGA